MTDRSKQDKLLNAIDRLLAGEPVMLEGVDEEDSQRLLELAKELFEKRPEPTDDFDMRLWRRLEQGETIAAGPKAESGIRRRLLPRWVTLPRVAALAAVLVLGLGVAGLTGALIEGRGPVEITDKDMAAMQSAGGDNANGVAASGAAESQRSAEGASGVAGVPYENGGQLPDTGTDDAAATEGATVPGVRQVIQTADYEIEIASGEFQEKYSQLTALAAKYGGYVVSANTTASDDNEPINHGTVTIRVADINDNFSQAMAELDEVGKVVSRDVSGRDVTEEYVDLQSRLKNAQAHEASLLSLMAKAQTIDEMLMVESELNTVRSEIEQLQGRINYIGNRTDYATITINIYEQDAADGGKENGGTDWGFVDSLEYAGWLAVQTLNFVIMALGIIVPATLILALVTIIAYRLSQRRKTG